MDLSSSDGASNSTDYVNRTTPIYSINPDFIQQCVLERALIIDSSAGVYSLLLSYLPHLILNFSSLTYRSYRIVSVVIICLNDVLLTTLHCVREPNIQLKIGLAAHISGGLSGIALGFALYRGERSSALKLVRLVAAMLYCMFMIVCILLNVK